MFKNYLATKQDFRVIEDALQLIWHPKLDFVFRDKTAIRTTVVVSFDSKFIYLWSQTEVSKLTRVPCRLKNYFAYKISHNLSISSESHRAWHAGLPPEIENLLPSSIKHSSTFTTPRIGGGLLTPFTTFQKSLNPKNNPYTTRQSYLATVVHEFGHVYWNQHKLWWPSDKQENLEYLTIAKRLYENKQMNSKVLLHIPSAYGLSEVFATCAEYCASEIFWPKHKKNFDVFAQNRLEKLIAEENKKDLDREDSVLESTRYLHDFAIVFGKILLALHPKTWPQILLTRPKIL